MKRCFLFLLLLASLFAAGCRTPAFEPQEKDKLTDHERYALYDYARGFIRQSGKVRLTPEEMQYLKKDPDTRIHYTAPKTGRASLSWMIRGEKQLIVTAEGPLRIEKKEEPEWTLRIINYSKGAARPSIRSRRK